MTSVKCISTFSRANETEVEEIVEIDMSPAIKMTPLDGVELTLDDDENVGANGSGKSNFFFAIMFLLDAGTGTLRAQERKELLHEGTGAHVLTAYVEITFDNSDGRLPSEGNEVTIKRQIGIKKDEYFIDRKHATKNEVTALLETAGFSRSNPYNIVPQGKVNVLATATDSARLVMFKEIAGTVVYDTRRAESETIMLSTSDRMTKVKDMLREGERRLKELNAEKDELDQFMKLDRRRKIAEYTYYDKELRRAKAELEKMESQRGNDNKKSKDTAKEADELKVKVKEAETSLSTVSDKLQAAQAECRTLTSEHKEAVKTHAKLETTVKQAEVDGKRRAESERSMTRELGEIEQQVAEVEEKLARDEPAVKAKAEDAERCRREVEKTETMLQELHSREARTSQFASKAARDTHLRKEVTELKASLKKKEKQATALQKDIDDGKARMGEADQESVERRKVVAERRAEAQTARARCEELRAEQNKVTDERKALQRQERDLQHERKTASDALEKAHRTLQHSMSRSQWEAICAVRRIVEQQRVKGVHGMLIELFTTNEKFNTAVDVAAGNQLFQFVVDNDEIASRMVKELQKANAGRVTFMPLAQLNPGADPAYPDGKEEECLPFLDKRGKVLQFDQKFRPAFASIFRTHLLVKDLEAAGRISRSHNLDCVDLDGDTVNRKGAMAGGFIEVRRSRVGAQADIKLLTAEVAQKDAELAEVATALSEVDQRVTSVLSELHKHELIAQKALAAAELEALDLPAAGASSSRSADAHKASSMQKERAHAALLAALESDRGRLATFEKELQAPFDSTLSVAEQAKIKELHASVQGLQKERDAADSEAKRVEADAASLRSTLSEHLQPRHEELTAEIARLAEAAEPEGDSIAQLEAARERLAASKEALEAVSKQREDMRSEELACQSGLEQLRNKLAQLATHQAEEVKLLDRHYCRRALLLQKRDEFEACIRKLGSLPKDATSAAEYAGSSSKQLLAEIEKCHKELGKLGHVNKKAIDQFKAFSDQRDVLLEKQAELDKARASIEELIEHLDHKKDEAIVRTFKGVSKAFKRSVEALLPGGTGHLSMKKAHELPDSADAKERVENYTGVTIYVRFPGGGHVKTMEELSGGQKTMVALCLIFAIQACDSAPFYIFDEIDAALDSTHRASLAAMIQRLAEPPEDDEDEEDEAEGKVEKRQPVQFITTTFRPELIRAADKCFGVTAGANKASTIDEISNAEALRIIAEDQDRQKQHAGITTGTSASPRPSSAAAAASRKSSSANKSAAAASGKRAVRSS